MNCNVSVVWKCNWRPVGIFARLNLGDYLCYSIFLIFSLLFLILVESKMKLQVINLLSYRSFNESADENREAHDCLMTEEVAFDNNRIVFQKIYIVTNPPRARPNNHSCEIYYKNIKIICENTNFRINILLLWYHFQTYQSLMYNPTRNELIQYCVCVFRRRLDKV